MSDYFGALMRSSGLAVGGAAPIVAPRPGAPMPVEVHVEQPAARPQPAMSPARAAQTAQTRTPPMPAQPVLEQPMQHSAHEPAAPRTPAQSPSPMERATAAHRAIEADAPPAPQAQLTSHSLVRAAMQWVAAGPQEIRAKPLAAIDPPVATTRPQPDPRSPDEIAEQRPPVRAESAEWQSSHEPPLPLPSRPPTPQPATLRAEPPAPAPPRDDTIEVSIGAIHVRVDAPATQTVARTPPPSPAPRAAAAPRPERSALARRALRRI